VVAMMVATIAAIAATTGKRFLFAADQRQAHGSQKHANAQN